MRPRWQHAVFGGVLVAAALAGQQTASASTITQANAATSYSTTYTATTQGSLAVATKTYTFTGVVWIGVKDYCLDDPTERANYPVRAWTCNYGAHQQWVNTWRGNIAQNTATLQVRLKNTNLCVSNKSGYAVMETCSSATWYLIRGECWFQHVCPTPRSLSRC